MKKFLISLVALVGIAAGLLVAQQGNQVIPTAGGGASGQTVAPNQNGVINVSANCGSQTNCVTMGAGFQIYDAAITSGQNTVTSTNFTFTSGMIGWLAHYTNCSASPCVGSVYEFPLNAGAENTITGCSPSCPSHVATLTQNASATVAAGSGIFTFGPNDDAGWTALESALAALSTAPNCPTVQFGGGFYMTRRGRFNAVTCLNPAMNFSFTSNTDKQVTISGPAGPYQSYIEPTQDFDFTTGLGNSCGGGISNNTCFGGSQATVFTRIGVDGGGASLTGSSHSVNIVEGDTDSYLLQFYCTNWGASDSAMNAWNIVASQPNAFNQFVGCGKTQLIVNANPAQVSDSFLGGTTGTVLTVNSGKSLRSNQNGIGYINTCPNAVHQWEIIGSMQSNLDAIGTCGNVNSIGINVQTGGSINATQLTASAGGSSASSAIVLNGTAVGYCTGCLFQSAGFALNVSSVTAGGGFLSGGGNTYNGTVNAVFQSATGYMILSPTDHLIGGLTIGNGPSCTFTSGGGTSPSCAVQAGSTVDRGVIIATTGTGTPSSTGTITFTFGQTYALNGNAPACTISLDDSGTGWGNEASSRVSTQSTTAPLFAWTNLASGTLTALTVSSPYRIDYQCSAR